MSAQMLSMVTLSPYCGDHQPQSPLWPMQPTISPIGQVSTGSVAWVSRAYDQYQSVGWWDQSV